MRKLGLRAEAAVARVELLESRGGDLVDQGQRQLAAAAGEALIVLDGGHDAGGRLERLVAALAPDLGHGEQHAAKAGAAVAVVGREIGAAEVGPAVGSEKCGQRPAALAADGRDRGLVARIHIGPLVAIHLDGDKMLVDERGDLRVLVGLAVHDVAPVAPDGANVEQDGLVFGLGARKGRFAPRMPLHRLMARRAQVGEAACSSRLVWPGVWESSCAWVENTW